MPRQPDPARPPDPPASAGFLDGLLGNGFDLVAAVDRAGDVLYASPSVIRDLGHGDVGSLLDIVHPDDVGRVGAALEALVAGTVRIGPMETRLRDVAGGWHTYEAVASSAVGTRGERFIALNARLVRSEDQGAGLDPDRAELLAGLRLAVDRGELRLAYQPQVSLQSDLVVGFEALARWERPGRGLVPPAEFMPLAEAHGLMGDIGRWVLREACEQLGRWRRADPAFARLHVAVNVSPVQLGPDLVGDVNRALRDAGLDAGSLCLEVTESALMRDVPVAVATVGALKGLGVRISIDDFGTGYSSLAQLRRLEVDELKIDRSFVVGMGERPEDTAVVAAVVAMAHALGLTVVAEGIEDTGQLEQLRRLGCELAQGYLFARPLMADAVTSTLAAPASGSTSMRPPSAAPRVLVVDDAEDVLMLASVSLTTAGFDVAQARSGREALAAFAAHQPDLVLLDVGLPDLPGTEVCREIRASARGAAVRVVMLTAKDDQAHKLEAYGVGADDYVVKPFSPRDLVGRSWAVLRRPRG